MNVPGMQQMNCPCGNCNGKMSHDKYDFTRYGGVTPLQDISGITSYAISMWYDCNKCTRRYKANDGRLFFQVPFRYRQGYPVDPRFAIKYEHHLTLTTTRVLESLMLTYGNGDQISKMLYELLGLKYEDLQESFFDHVIETNQKTNCGIPSFHEFHRGKVGIGGFAVCDRYDFAAASALTSTGISSNERRRNEIQAVTCQKVSASDHTFATIDLLILTRLSPFTPLM